PPYLRLGTVPRKRHIAHRHEPGFKGEGIYYEEVVTAGGFSRAYSIAYHLRPPTRVTKIESCESAAVETGPQETLRHHHIKTKGVPRTGDPVSGRVPMLANADVVMSRCRPAASQSELYRNADADEVIFVHHGRGTLHSMYGPLPFREFDYIV